MKILYLFMFLLLSGCSSLGVEPWERDQLAREDMAIDNAPLDSAFDDHIYFSKEVSSGGGCGCN
ncbi:MAG: DUF4266 domain-containing protein [Psychromonas sp.]|nr:DUF4266 domain-containing protein [Alteromonadales bacterium]MCP5078080.1 DUF4266 domain-containing protein [Psychromonas sp.]